MSQTEMARAIGDSQQTVSRLLAYFDSLSPGQQAQVTKEREPSSLAAMIAEEDKRRAIRNEIYDAYHAGDQARVDELWRQHQLI
jgi:hypothetical protein